MTPEAQQTELIQDAVTLYQACMTDIVLAPAAFGLAVSMLSLSCDINVRTAALLLEQALQAGKTDA